jgi:lipid-binding SYLF domain-containing protein
MRASVAAPILILLALLTGGCASSTPGDVKAQALIDQSKATVELFKSRRAESTPLFNAALRDARGIMIFPDVFEAAVGVGGQGGSGVMLTRDTSGAWGYPAFYRISGGTLGVQLGAQSSEVIFLLMTDTAVRAVIDSPGQFGLGAQATFGELGSGGSSATTLKGSDIVGFTKGSGLFLGAAASGAYVAAQPALNQSFYHNSQATPAAILLQHQVANPGADALRQALAVSSSGT